MISGNFDSYIIMLHCKPIKQNILVLKPFPIIIKKHCIAITVSCLAILVFLILLLRTYVFDLIVINGDSMFPTLIQKDRVILNKLAYKSQPPHRDDIISFKMGYNRLVKRVIGIPGDVLEFKDGLLYCNNKGLPVKQDRNSRLSYRYYYKPRVIQTRHFFVIGDNTGMSIDSRIYGTILYEDIVGKVVFKYYPLKRIGRLK
jgi:signal peptidase I